MKERSNILLGAIVSIFSVVAILVLLAYMFTNGDFGMERGTGYGVIFGFAQGKSMNAIPLLIVAFVFECVSILGGIVVAFPGGKVGAIGFGLLAVILALCGTAFLFSVNLYKAANASIISDNVSSLALGPAPIVNAVFAYMGALLSAFGAYKGLTAN
jgi:hypothetical protein